MLPFAIDRHSRESLTDQVAGGLRRAIQSGRYTPGDTLPTIDRTASTLGVSTNVVQTAIKRLSREGLVTARPRRGIQVCPAGPHVRWQGHVLYLHWGSASSFYEAVSSETVVHRLLGRGILVTPIHLDGTEAAAGYARVLAAVQAGPVDMAILSGPANGVGVLLAEHDIPFIHLAGNDEPAGARLARRILLQDPVPSAREAVEHALACGVRAMTIVDGWGTGSPVKDAAEAAGLEVNRLIAKPVRPLGDPESVELGGLQAVARWLDGGAVLPDLIYFADDFIAQGGLTALLERGVRIPRDVQVIAWSNRCSGPVLSKPLTRIEMDPRHVGDRVAELAIEALKKPNRKKREPVVIGPAFIVGETTVIQTQS